MTMNKKPRLVVDSSFARWESKKLDSLVTKYDFVVPSTFVYEVLTTSQQNRREELRYFPSFRRIDIQAAMNFERTNGSPVSTLDTQIVRGNPAILENNWSLEPSDKSVLVKYENDYLIPVLNLWREVMQGGTVPGFSNRELKNISGTESDFQSLCRTLHSHERVMSFAEGIEWAHASRLTPKWLHYRVFQAWALQALNLLRRSGGNATKIAEQQLKHDTNDLEYLILGMHVGALATAEVGQKPTSMSWRYTALCPTGVLIVPQKRTSNKF